MVPFKLLQQGLDITTQQKSRKMTCYLMKMTEDFNKKTTPTPAHRASVLMGWVLDGWGSSTDSHTVLGTLIPQSESKRASTCRHAKFLISQDDGSYWVNF